MRTSEQLFIFGIGMFMAAIAMFIRLYYRDYAGLEYALTLFGGFIMGMGTYGN